MSLSLAELETKYKDLDELIKQYDSNRNVVLTWNQMAMPLSSLDRYKVVARNRFIEARLVYNYSTQSNEYKRRFIHTYVNELLSHFIIGITHDQYPEITITEDMIPKKSEEEAMTIFESLENMQQGANKRTVFTGLLDMDVSKEVKDRMNYITIQELKQLNFNDICFEVYRLLGELSNVNKTRIEIAGYIDVVKKNTYSLVSEEQQKDDIATNQMEMMKFNRMLTELTVMEENIKKRIIKLLKQIDSIPTLSSEKKVSEAISDAVMTTSDMFVSTVTKLNALEEHANFIDANAEKLGEEIKQSLEKRLAEEYEDKDILRKKNRFQEEDDISINKTMIKLKLPAEQIPVPALGNSYVQFNPVPADNPLRLVPDQVEVKLSMNMKNHTLNISNENASSVEDSKMMIRSRKSGKTSRGTGFISKEDEKKIFDKYMKHRIYSFLEPYPEPSIDQVSKEYDEDDITDNAGNRKVIEYEDPLNIPALLGRLISLPEKLKPIEDVLQTALPLTTEEPLEPVDVEINYENDLMELEELPAENFAFHTQYKENNRVCGVVYIHYVSKRIKYSQKERADLAAANLIDIDLVPLSRSAVTCELCFRNLNSDINPSVVKKIAMPYKIALDTSSITAADGLLFIGTRNGMILAYNIVPFLRHTDKYRGVDPDLKEDEHENPYTAPADEALEVTKQVFDKPLFYKNVDGFKNEKGLLVDFDIDEMLTRTVVNGSRPIVLVFVRYLHYVRVLYVSTKYHSFNGFAKLIDESPGATACTRLLADTLMFSVMNKRVYHSISACENFMGTRQTAVFFTPHYYLSVSDSFNPETQVLVAYRATLRGPLLSHVECAYTNVMRSVENIPLKTVAPSPNSSDEHLKKQYSAALAWAEARFSNNSARRGMHMAGEYHYQMVIDMLYNGIHAANSMLGTLSHNERDLKRVYGFPNPPYEGLIHPDFSMYSDVLGSEKPSLITSPFPFPGIEYQLMTNSNSSLEIPHPNFKILDNFLITWEKNEIFVFALEVTPDEFTPTNDSQRFAQYAKGMTSGIEGLKNQTNSPLLKTAAKTTIYPVGTAVLDLPYVISNCEINNVFMINYKNSKRLCATRGPFIYCIAIFAEVLQEKFIKVHPNAQRACLGLKKFTSTIAHLGPLPQDQKSSDNYFVEQDLINQKMAYNNLIISKVMRMPNTVTGIYEHANIGEFSSSSSSANIDLYKNGVLIFVQGVQNRSASQSISSEPIFFSLESFFETYNLQDLKPSDLKREFEIPDVRYLTYFGTHGYELTERDTGKNLATMTEAELAIVRMKKIPFLTRSYYNQESDFYVEPWERTLRKVSVANFIYVKAFIEEVVNKMIIQELYKDRKELKSVLKEESADFRVVRARPGTLRNHVLVINKNNIKRRLKKLKVVDSALHVHTANLIAEQKKEREKEMGIDSDDDKNEDMIPNKKLPIKNNSSAADKVVSAISLFKEPAAIKSVDIELLDDLEEKSDEDSSDEDDDDISDIEDDIIDAEQQKAKQRNKELNDINKKFSSVQSTSDSAISSVPVLNAITSVTSTECKNRDQLLESQIFDSTKNLQVLGDTFRFNTNLMYTYAKDHMSQCIEDFVVSYPIREYPPEDDQLDQQYTAARTSYYQYAQEHGQEEDFKLEDSTNILVGRNACQVMDTGKMLTSEVKDDSKKKFDPKKAALLDATASSAVSLLRSATSKNKEDSKAALIVNADVELD